VAQTQKSQRTAARIAAAAGELFFTQGYAETTIAQVAAASEVATGTVMLHFGSKSELATAAFADRIAAIVQDSAAALEASPGESMREELAAFVRPIYAWYGRNAEVAPDLLREALFADGPWADHYGRTVAATVAVFAKICERHRPSLPDAALVGEGLLADYLIVLLRGLRGTFATIEDQVDRFSDLATTRVGE